MITKETIALIGIDNEDCAALVKKLAQGNYRLLLISHVQYSLAPLHAEVLDNCPQADVEIIDCAKDACWEADIIALFGEANYNKELIARIKVVSTQKIVAGVSINRSKEEISLVEANNLQRLLPHSNVVQVFHNPESSDVLIAGDDVQSTKNISNIAAAAGYKPILVEGWSMNKL